MLAMHDRSGLAAASTTGTPVENGDIGMSSVFEPPCARNVVEVLISYLDEVVVSVYRLEGG